MADRISDGEAVPHCAGPRSGRFAIGGQFAGRVACLPALADAIRTNLNPNPADISEVMDDLAKSLDASTTGVGMPAKPAPVMDLSKIDFGALRRQFKDSKHKNTDLEVLKAAIRAQLEKLIRPAPELTPEERAEVKKVARELLNRLQQLLVLNWRQKSTSRSQLKLAIEDVLDTGLPRAYGKPLYEQKCSALFEHTRQSQPPAPLVATSTTGGVIRRRVQYGPQ